MWHCDSRTRPVVLDHPVLCVFVYNVKTVLFIYFRVSPCKLYRTGRLAVPTVLLRADEARLAPRRHRVLASRHLLGTLGKRDVHAQPLQACVRQGRVRYLIRVDLPGRSDRVRSRKSRRGKQRVTATALYVYAHNIFYSLVRCFTD